MSPRPRRLFLAAAALLIGSVVPLAMSPATAAAPANGNTYTEYDLDLNGGEPLVGYNPGRGEAYAAAGLTTYKMTWDAKGVMTKTNITPPNSTETLDTILVTDPRTHRTFVSYLLLACSHMQYTDDGGESWELSAGCGPGALVDHQTVGVGPLHAPLNGGVTGYDGSVYYCAQDAYNGMCSVSVDGGVTFGPGVPVANTPANKIGDVLGGKCSALHGHVQVGPDGTAYLPLKGCDGVPTLNNLSNSEYFGGRPSLTVSEDNGASWQVRFGPAGSHNPDEADPFLGIAKSGKLYFGWQDGTNPTDAVGGDQTKAMVATSEDGGNTWSKPVDVSSGLGLHNIQFPTVVVGDDDRAAFAFVGTPGIGNDQDNAFRGDWHLYVATTYDGGATWTTVNATPTNLINRGCVHMLGLAPGSQRTDKCDFRNMLDFNDINVDKDGRVLVAYTDACGEDCSAADGVNADQRKVRVLRQTCGKGLYAAGDAVIASTCASTIGAAPTTGGTGTGGTGGTAAPAQPRVPSTGLPGALAVVGAVLTGAALLLRRARRAA